MSYLDEIKFPYYPSNVYETTPLGNVTLRQFIKGCSNPRPEIITLFEQIIAASEAGDLVLKNELKKKLYYFNPCVTTNGLGRSYTNITSFTGLVQIDFDGIEHAEEFRDAFFKKVKSCVVAMVSPSGLGMKALLRIPVVETPDAYKEYFCGLGYYLSSYQGYDSAPFNPLLPLYLCYDPDLKYREDAVISEIRGRKIDAFGTSGEDFKPNEEISTEMITDRKRMITASVNKISDNAHPKIVSLSTYVGGLIGGGYFGEEEIYAFMCDLIEENEYMQKDVKGYKKTCLTMLRKGQSSPVA